MGLDRVDDSPDLSISPDYRAVATTFSKFVIETETGKGARECDVTRSASIRLPVTGPAQAAWAHFFAQGYVFADQGASARLTIRANGQVKAKRFPAGFDDSYVEGLEFPVTPGATYTLSVQWEVHQDPDTGDTPTSTSKSPRSSPSTAPAYPGAGWWSTG